MSTEDLEGWCTDPFGRHEARWLSEGKPTKLVRDAGVESYEDPPDEEWTVTPSLIVVEVAPDTRQSDELREEMRDAGTFGAAWGSHAALPGRLDDEGRH